MRDPLHRSGVLLLILTLLLVTAFSALGQGEEETVSVVSEAAPLRTEPDIESEILASLPRGTLLIFIRYDESKGWVQAQTQDGMAGWLEADQVHINGPYIPPEDGVSRIYVDGKAEDWERFYVPYTDEIGDSTGAVDLRAVRSFMNDQYAYILVEVDGDPTNINLLLVEIVTNNDGVYQAYLLALPPRGSGTLFEVTEEAGVARDASTINSYREEALEIRLPLALLGDPAAFSLVGVSIREETRAGLVVTDDLREVMPAIITLETEPSLDGQTSTGVRVNLRAAPVNGDILRVLDPETPLSLMGRTFDSQWIYIRLSDAFPGWISAEYLTSETQISDLPILE